MRTCVACTKICTLASPIIAARIPSIRGMSFVMATQRVCMFVKSSCRLVRPASLHLVVDKISSHTHSSDTIYMRVVPCSLLLLWQNEHVVLGKHSHSARNSIYYIYIVWIYISIYSLFIRFRMVDGTSSLSNGGHCEHVCVCFAEFDKSWQLGCSDARMDDGVPLGATIRCLCCWCVASWPSVSSNVVVGVVGKTTLQPRPPRVIGAQQRLS